MSNKWGNLPRGVTVRENKSGQSLQIAFTYSGMQCREPISLPANRRNINYASNLLGEIKGAIERNAFKYAQYFPNSTKAKLFGGASNNDKTILEYLNDYQQAAIIRGLSPSTIDGYRKLKNSLKELHELPVRHLTSARLKVFITQSNNSSKTLRNKLSYLRSALAEAVTEGVIDINPINSIKMSNYTSKNNKINLDNENDDVTPFLPYEIEKIYEACRGDEINIVKLVMNTGLRSSEWSALKWSDVNIENKEISIKRAMVQGVEKCPKTKAGRRTIPLNEIAMSALLDQMSKSYSMNEFVFTKSNKTRVQLPNRELNRINPDSFRKHRWGRIIKEAGIKYRYPYQMRHTFATMHISTGTNLWQLAKWMGHSSPEMLFNHYGNFIEEHQTKTKEIHTSITQKAKE